MAHKHKEKHYVTNKIDLLLFSKTWPTIVNLIKHPLT